MSADPRRNCRVRVAPRDELVEPAAAPRVKRTRRTRAKTPPPSSMKIVLFDGPIASALGLLVFASSAAALASILNDRK